MLPQDGTDGTWGPAVCVGRTGWREEDTEESGLGVWVAMVPFSETGHLGGGAEQIQGGNKNSRLNVLRVRCLPVGCPAGVFH